MRHLSPILYAMALLVADAAGAQKMRDWDTDASGDLSRDEWAAGMASGTDFADWDADGSGTLDAGEFAGGVFGRLDTDDDDALSQAEFDAGAMSWLGTDAASQSFTTWDADRDGTISSDEFLGQYQAAGLFEQVLAQAGIDTAADGLAQDQFAAGLFDWMDTDRNDLLAEGEHGWFN